LAAPLGYHPHELALNRQKRLSWRQWRAQALRFAGVALGGLLLTLAPMVVVWGLLSGSSDQSLSQSIGDSRAWIGYGLGLALACVYILANYRALLLGLDILLGRVRAVRGKGRTQGAYFILGNYRFLMEASALAALPDDLTYRAFILPYSQTLLSLEYAD
jgi:hypothetical protein